MPAAVATIHWTSYVTCLTLDSGVPRPGRCPPEGGLGPGDEPGKGNPMTHRAQHTPTDARTRSRVTRRRTLHPRGGCRLLAPLAGIAFATALVTGCGAGETEEPSTETAAEGEAPADGGEADDGVAGDDDAEDGSADDSDTDSGAGDDASDPDDDSDDTSDDGTSEDGDDSTDDSDDTSDGQPAGENLFEGTWGFGHDTKVLDAEELGDVLEEEAEARGPEEMSLEVECGDGVDTGAEDYTAECIAYADEGVEHAWLVTVGPADAGLELEVENAG